MFNCLYNTPISYNNPAPMPVAINYISGYARGIDMSYYGGGYQANFTGSIPSSIFVPQTYTFGQGGNSNVDFTGCYSENKTYNFTGSSSITYTGSNKSYNFGGDISTSLTNSNSNYNFTGGILGGTSTSCSTPSTPTSVKNTPSTQKQSPKTTPPVSPQRSTTPTSNSRTTDLRSNFVTVAYKYYGDNEADGSHKKFCINSGCNIFNEGEWCTDFVTYVVKESYKNNGKTVPFGFGNHDVETLKNWAIRNNYFTRTSNLSNSPSFIAQNIKPGDIMILNERDASHTGFVTKVEPDGSFQTIEGNRGDMVTNATYRPGTKEYNKLLSGFIQLT